MRIAVRPIIAGLVAFVAWIGIWYLVIAGFLSGAGPDSKTGLMDYFAIGLIPCSLFITGFVAGWVDPVGWKINSLLLGVFCTLTLGWFSAISGDAIFVFLYFVLGVGIAIAGARTSVAFIHWLRAQ